MTPTLIHSDPVGPTLDAVGVVLAVVEAAARVLHAVVEGVRRFLSVLGGSS